MNEYNVKSVAKVIILTIITCGIYYYVWQYRTVEDIKRYLNAPNATSGGMVVLLSIVTCGIYGIYWWYVVGKDQMLMQEKAGLPITDNKVLYLILSIFSFDIINMGILQNELNSIYTQGNKSDLDF